MSDLLQTIKNEVAKEYGFETWQVFQGPNFRLVLDFAWPEVCKRYAKEVAKASLKKASEEIFIKLVLPIPMVPIKSVITDESNIVL